jgi:hypothetical protein
VSTEPESAPEIIDELRSFWQFLQRQYQLPAAAGILPLLDHRAEQRLRDELANPANYGMAKSFFMQGMQAGFDMTTKEGTEAFMLAYNAAQLARLEGLPGLPGEDLDKGAGRVPFLPSSPLGPYLPPSPLTHEEKARKRKERKAQRQARKRNRRK